MMSKEKSRTVLFLLSSGADEENMRFISRCLRKHDASYQVQGLDLENRDFTDDMIISSIRDYAGQSPVEILRTIKPSIMVTGDDAGIPYRAFVEAAKFLGIPSLLMTPGIIVGKVPFSLQSFKGILWLLVNLRSTFNKYRFLWASLRDCQQAFLQSALLIVRDLMGKFYHTFLYGHRGCSKIAVAGDYTRNLFIKEGIPSENIVVTGLPRGDGILSKSFDRDAFRKRLKLVADKPVVSLFTDAQVEHRLWTKRRRRDFIIKVLLACQELPEVQFVIKLHPYEDAAAYQHAVKELGWNIPVSKDIPLHEMINASDAIMTGVSTTGLETLILNRPLIILNFYNQAEYIPYVSEGVAVGVNRARELPAAIRKVLYERQTEEMTARKRENFLHQHLYLQDGKASQRVADLIMLMIANQSPVAESKLAAASKEA